MRVKSRTAEHRPAVRKGKFRHDVLVAVDLFSGYGGLTRGVEAAGFEVILAANHNRHKIEVHEANHPHAEHWIADLVDRDAADYHSVRDLPPAALLCAGISCINHTIANTKKAYTQGLSLFDLDDPEFDERVTRSERDRATANCVLHYAAEHHPLMIVVECTTELTSWGQALPNRPKVGDGSTYRWWLKQFDVLGYHHKVLYLNSQFFGVPQSRDRLYIVMWDRKLRAPDLDHRPESWCGTCDSVVEAVWSWKTGVPPTGVVRYGAQYNYRCPRCHHEVVPPVTPSLVALDLTKLGTKIGDRPLKKFIVNGETIMSPLAPATMARAQRCLDRFGEFPAILMPTPHVAQPPLSAAREPVQTASSQSWPPRSTGAILQMANSFERPGSQCRTRDLTQPLWTQLATNTTGLLQPGIALGINNFQGAPRGVNEALPVQGASETLSLMSSGVIPFRKNTRPTSHVKAMPTVTSEQIPGLLSAAGVIKNNGSLQEAKYRAHPVSAPLGAVTSENSKSLLFSGWADSPAFGDWQAALADLTLQDCYFRMMFAHEVGRGCGFDVSFGEHRGDFIVWGKPRDQVDGFGNAVSPPVGEWIGGRCRAVLHSESVAS